MSSILRCLMLFIVVASIYSDIIINPKKSTPNGLIDSDLLLEAFQGQGTKSLFKAWHFVHNKDYDYNTEEGIKRYQIFKVNYNKMIEHNKSGQTWLQGLNHLSDMTDEEIGKFYNLKPFSEKEFAKNLKIQGATNVSYQRNVVYARPQVDYRKNALSVRNQQNCGSCWAFATQAVLETSYQLWQGPLQDHLSTQQSVDCDDGNGGCNGGFYFNSFGYFEKATMVYEGAYKYTALKGVCRYKNGMEGDTNVKITGYSYYFQENSPQDRSGFDNLLKRGPVGVGVGVNSDWYRYKSGVYHGNGCPESNHAVVVVGYQCDEKCDGCYFIIRNSWGVNWGEEGHIKIKDNGEGKTSCNVEKIAFAPNGFKKN